jgi:hypothetical protein
VLNLWNGISPTPSTLIEMVSLDAELPPFELHLEACQEFASLLESYLPTLSGDVVETEAQFLALRIDRTAFVTVPGEPITAIGDAIRSPVTSLGFDHTFVLGLTNGHMGYITSAEEYDFGGYESCGTMHGRGTGDFVVAKALEVASLLSPPEETPPPPDDTPDDEVEPEISSSEGGCGCRTNSAPFGAVFGVFFAMTFLSRRRRR